MRKNKTQNEAASDCKTSYFASLVTVNDVDLALFLSDALAQSEYIYDNLWTAGRRLNTSEKGVPIVKWIWENNLRKIHEINKTILEILNETNKEFDFPLARTHCLAFGRKRHAEVLFQDLDCQARRQYICERWSK